MGAVTSRLDESQPIFIRDQSRCTSGRCTCSDFLVVALQSIRVTDGQDREVLTILFKEPPANKVIASNEAKRPIEYIQVPSFHNHMRTKGCDHMANMGAGSRTVDHRNSRATAQITTS
jgi:hypothetical protein